MLTVRMKREYLLHRVPGLAVDDGIAIVLDGTSTEFQCADVDLVPEKLTVGG